MGNYPQSRHSIPLVRIEEGHYRMRFLNDPGELERVLRLRFEVFNLELGEGFESSFETMLDEDPYDPWCHHLIVEDKNTEAVVGTYRLQTFEMAGQGLGFYSAEEFDFSEVSEDVLRSSVELGRACIEKTHRNTQVLYLLWKGLAAYVSHNQKRYLFGCCSLTSQDQNEGYLIMDQLRKGERLHREIRVRPLPEVACYPAGYAAPVTKDVQLPKLFRTYLRFGALVCGEPAIDRQFKTIDYLVIFDTAMMDDHMRMMFFEQGR